MYFDPREFLLDKGFIKSSKKAETYFNTDGISMKFFKTGKHEEMISIMDLTKNWNSRHMANIKIPDNEDDFIRLLYYVSVEV